MKRLIKYKQFILESSKYKGIEDEKFLKLFNRIIHLYGESNVTYINDFKEKLYEFLSDDNYKLHRINFFDKPKYKNLINLIHELDKQMSKMFMKKRTSTTSNISIDDLVPVWKDISREIYVYRANSVFESIKLGRNTRFCISSSLDGKHNYFYDYMYNYFEDETIDEDGYDIVLQYSTIYFIISPKREDDYKTIAIDVIPKYSEYDAYKYSDIRNEDVLFHSYQNMINGDERHVDDTTETPLDNYDTSPDLQYIPESVFEFVEHYPTIEELKVEPKLFKTLDRHRINYIVDNYVKTIDDYNFLLNGCENLRENDELREEIEEKIRDYNINI